MEKVEYHTPEEKKVCDWIRGRRLSNRKYNHCKSVQFPILDYNGKNVSVGLIITYNKNTQNVSFGHYLSYNGYNFYPTTNEKLRCINTHAKEQYIKAVTSKKNLLKSRVIHFSDTIEPYINLFETLYYNKTGTITFSSSFTSSHGVKLKHIDER